MPAVECIAVNMRMQDSDLISLNIYPVMGLQDAMVVLSLVLEELSIMAVF